MKNYSLCLVLFMLFACLSCDKKEDTPDPTTNPPTTNPPTGNEPKKFVVDETFKSNISDRFVYKGARTPDGKIVLVGDELIRINSDGTLDPSFKQAEEITNGRIDLFSNIIIDANGKILLSGHFGNYDFGDTRTILLIRLNPDGSLDKDFNILEHNNSGSQPSVDVMHLQPDGKIIVGGNFLLMDFNGTPSFAPNLPDNIMRLNADGTFDDSFKFGLENSGGVSHILGLPDGNMIMVGSFLTTPGSSNSKTFLKINKEGIVDPSFQEPDLGDSNKDIFDPNLISSYNVNAVTLTNDGKIMIGGNFNKEGIHNLARLNMNGSVDDSFKTKENIADTTPLGIPLAIQPLPNGKFLIGGGDGFGTPGPYLNILDLLDATGNKEENELGYESQLINQILPVGNNEYILFRDFYVPNTSKVYRMLKIKVD